MNMKMNANKNRILWSVFTVLCLIFIFSQSLLPADTSGNESSRVVDFLNFICEYIGVSVRFTGHFVRKCAHFTEFSVLGFFVFNTFRAYVNKVRFSFIFAPLTCAAVAVIDECLQLMSKGRACSVSDMLLDSCGAVFGILIAILCYMILCRFVDMKNKGDSDGN